MLYLLGVCGLRGDELQLDVIVETQADSDLLLDAERLQAEEAAAARSALQEVQVERLRQSCHTHTEKRQIPCSDWLLHSEIWKQVKSELKRDRVSSVSGNNIVINCKPVTVWEHGSVVEMNTRVFLSILKKILAAPESSSQHRNSCSEGYK